MARPTIPVSDRFWGWFLFIGIAIILQVRVYSKGFVLLPEDPTLQNALVTKSLWHHGTLRCAHYPEIWEQCLETSRRDQKPTYQDAFALAVDGTLVPKHSYLTAILAVPFYALFGEVGFWLFNQCMVLLLFVALQRLSIQICGRANAVFWAIVSLLGTQLGAYLYGFHYDVAALALMLAGFAYAKDYPVVGAVLMFATVWIRLSNVMLIPFLFFAQRHNRRSWLLFSLGAAVALLPLFALHTVLFGGPLQTPYHRLPMFLNGEPIYFDPHTFGFDRNIFFADWDTKLFHYNLGLMSNNIALWFVPVGYFFAWKRMERRFLLWTLATVVSQLVYVFSYSYWNATAYGNRFLFTPIFLALLPLTVVYTRLLTERVRHERANSESEHNKPFDPLLG